MNLQEVDCSFIWTVVVVVGAVAISITVAIVGLMDALGLLDKGGLDGIEKIRPGEDVGFPSCRTCEWAIGKHGANFGNVYCCHKRAPIGKILNSWVMIRGQDWCAPDDCPRLEGQ